MTIYFYIGIFFRNLCSFIWDNLFKDRPSQSFGRQSLRNSKWYNLLKQTISIQGLWKVSTRKMECFINYFTSLKSQDVIIERSSLRWSSLRLLFNKAIPPHNIKVSPRNFGKMLSLCAVLSTLLWRFLLVSCHRHNFNSADSFVFILDKDYSFDNSNFVIPVTAAYTKLKTFI